MTWQLPSPPAYSTDIYQRAQLGQRAQLRICLTQTRNSVCVCVGGRLLSHLQEGRLGRLPGPSRSSGVKNAHRTVILWASYSSLPLQMLGKGPLLSGRAYGLHAEGCRFNVGHLHLEGSQLVGDVNDLWVRPWRAAASPNWARETNGPTQ